MLAVAGCFPSSAYQNVCRWPRMQIVACANYFGKLRFRVLCWRGLNFKQARKMKTKPHRRVQERVSWPTLHNSAASWASRQWLSPAVRGRVVAELRRRSEVARGTRGGRSSKRRLTMCSAPAGDRLDREPRRGLPEQAHGGGQVPAPGTGTAEAPWWFRGGCPGETPPPPESLLPQAVHPPSDLFHALLLVTTLGNRFGGVQPNICLVLLWITPPWTAGLFTAVSQDGVFLFG